MQYRLTNLLASRAVSALKAPSSLLTGGRSRIGRAALSALLRALQRWSGLDLLADLSDFVEGFEGMLDGFRQRATDINRVLHAPTTAFVLVTTLDPHTIETTIALYKELTVGGFPVAGVIANRKVSILHVERTGRQRRPQIEVERLKFEAERLRERYAQALILQRNLV